MQDITRRYMFKFFQFFITLFKAINLFPIPSKKQINKMLQIKSYKQPTNLSSTSSTLKNVFTNMCDKIDYQLQCKLNYPSAMSTPNRNKTKIDKDNKQNSRCKNIHRSFLFKSINAYKQHSPDNRIYLNVGIMNVNKKQEKIGHILECVILNKKCHPSWIKILRNQVVQVRKYSNNQGTLEEETKIELNMESMFKAYIQSNQGEVKESILQGKMQSKVVKPFLTMFQRIKLDSQYIAIECQNLGNLLSKIQFQKIFDQYKPKIRLQSQIQHMNATNTNIYQELYQKYEGLPIYGYEQNKKAQTVNQLRESSSKQDQTSCFHIQDELEDVSPPEVAQKQTQKQKTQQNEEILRETNDPQVKKTSIKQRFENRFKKHLRLISEEANDIIKARFQ